MSLALSLVQILLATATQAENIDVGTISLTGNFTLNHTFDFNPPEAAPFGTFGNLTVQSATGIFVSHVHVGDVLTMNTPFMYVSSGFTPVLIPCGGASYGSLPQPMQWSIGGFTINTLWDGVLGADFVGRYCLGLTDFSGNGFDPNAYPVYPCTSWSFTAPPYYINNFPEDIAGPINMTIAVQYACGPPEVTCSVTTSNLWPPNGVLTEVGFVASATDNCDGTVPASSIEVQVFSDEDELEPASGNFSPDAKNLTATGTLRLRAERRGDADGRVYLVVAKATDSAGNTGFCTSTVTVPLSKSAKSIASVAAQAAAAQDYTASHNGAPPPGYFVIGNGPVVGPNH